MGYQLICLADDVHVVGPQAVPFWLGSFSLLGKRFVQIVEAIEDKSSAVWADAQRLIAQISLDRADFEAQPDAEKTACLINMPVIELSPAGTGRAIGAGVVDKICKV